ncbi:MAG: tetratricopeptide repeat protein, partial [Caldilineaceae bacterium]|nr:tetratricopeptide repeat protein [Caldilineaceae bacterium]
LYEESLAIKEKLGDVQGRGATLSEMADLFRLQGDLARARTMLEESQEIARAMRDPAAVAFSVVKLGQLDQAQGNVAQARAAFQEGLAIFTRLGMPREAGQVQELLTSLADAPPSPPSPDEQLILFVRAAHDVATGRLPAEPLRQVIAQRQAQDDLPAQHRPLFLALADLAAGAPAATGSADGPSDESTDESTDALGRVAAAARGLVPAQPVQAAWWMALARLFAAHHRAPDAVDFQRQAVATLRTQGEHCEALQPLSVALFNLAGYLADADRLDDAVTALEEVVAIDRRCELDDLAADQQALAAMVRRRDGVPPLAPPLPDGQAGQSTPEAPSILAALDAQLHQLPPEQQAAARAQLDALARLSPDELEAALADAARRTQDAILLEHIDMVTQLLLDAIDDIPDPTARRTALAAKLDRAAAIWSPGEAADSPMGLAGQFAHAVALLLRGETLPPLPAPLAEPLAALRRRLGAAGWPL